MAGARQSHAAELVQREIELVGMPEWTKEEDDLARAVQAKAGVPVEGLKRAVDPLRAGGAEAAANDAGDVSWKVPMAKFYFPANIPNINAHHWAAGVRLATSIVHKGALAGAKVMAALGRRMPLGIPAAVAEAKRTFKEESAASSIGRCCPTIRSLRSTSTAPSWINSGRRWRSTTSRRSPFSPELWWRRPTRCGLA